MNTQIDAEAKAGRARWTVAAFVTSALAALGLIGITMAFAGYGVALAVETEFGIPHASVFKSSFDLLALSVWLFTWLLNNSMEVLREMFFSHSYWRAAAAASIFALVIWLITSGFMYLYTRKLKGCLVPKLQKAKNLTKAKTFFLVSGLIPVLTGLSVLTGAPLLLAAALATLSLCGIIPVLSLSAGTAHIQEYVIKPKGCFPLATRTERLESIEKQAKSNVPKEAAAHCIKLKDGDKTIATGRVVFSTTELIVLYDPRTGKVTRESLAGRSIEVVSELKY